MTRRGPALCHPWEEAIPRGAACSSVANDAGRISASMLLIPYKGGQRKSASIIIQFDMVGKLIIWSSSGKTRRRDVVSWGAWEDREPGPSSASLSPSNRAAISSGVSTWLIFAALRPPAFNLLATTMVLRPPPWEERPAGIFDPRPGTLTFGAPRLPLNPVFIHLMSNDCASSVTGDVHRRKQPQSCQAPVHFLK
jgi:hypothetical protein